ncbi:171_t:CDS:2 [Dentiscutata heterogama]|uniref:171_t:CDS:1 n=1 Tax=Dentiscutata heterogama TaxID=1316150 RepID=A0ACA9LIQ4_9GLOM|nr:171_t:CDS:2 [Dentiscutata heterogama]
MDDELLRPINQHNITTIKQTVMAISSSSNPIIYNNPSLSTALYVKDPHLSETEQDCEIEEETDNM